MTKALTIFNVLAGGSSIAGLYVSLVSEYKPPLLWGCFAITAIFCAYVLFVPGNPIQANVGNKLAYYHANPHIETVSILQDEFNLFSLENKDIPFPHPFASPPDVELIKLGGNSEIKAEITGITCNQFKVVNAGGRFNQSATYRWVARGVLLVESKPPRH